MRYRKKPVEVEAFQMTREAWERGPEFFPRWLIKAMLPEDPQTPAALRLDSTGRLVIETLEGPHRVSWGDFIIQGVKGELYPCKPDIFEMTYERVAPLPESTP